MKRSIVLALSALAIAPAASAASPEGLFIGGFGELNIPSDSKDSKAKFDFIEDGQGLGLEVGYFFDPRLGARVEWSSLEFERAGGRSDVDEERYGVDLLYRFKDHGAAYAIAGIKHLTAGDEDTVVNLGLGAQGTITGNLAAFAEVAAYVGDHTDFGAKLGLRYGFGAEPAAAAVAPAAANVQPAAVAMADGEMAPVDSDKDGVIDDNDLCPDSAMEYAVDANGCVIIEEVQVKETLRVQFVKNSADITGEYLARIGRFADFMKQYQNTSVELQGHTCSMGSDHYNQKLSEKRAHNVASMLVNEFGVSQERVSYKGYGETQLIDNSGTEAGEHINRRVDASITATELRKKQR